jgi:tetratricopeptide (TPR) repeat protein
MKKISLLFMCTSLTFGTYAQQPDVAKALADEGVKLHDQGDFLGAIKKYDESLLADADNLLALSEKAYSLLAVNKPEKSIEACERALARHKENPGLKIVYVTYGNALDLTKEPKKAVNIYNQGIKLFPDFYLLHFNKGITLSGMQKYEEAAAAFQSAMKANPVHASSHNGLARLSEITNDKIPAILAYSRFLMVEPESTRAKENALNLQRLANSGAKQTGENEITISFDPGTMKKVGSKKKKENDFSSAELFLGMSSALDYDEKNKGKTQVELFTDKMESLFAILAETRSANHGFFWEYYVPYFAEMKEKKFSATFSNVVFASAGDVNAKEWLKNHKEEVQKLILWSKSYSWPG